MTPTPDAAASDRRPRLRGPVRRVLAAAAVAALSASGLAACDDNDDAQGTIDSPSPETEAPQAFGIDLDQPVLTAEAEHVDIAGDYLAAFGPTDTVYQISTGEVVFERTRGPEADILRECDWYVGLHETDDGGATVVLCDDNYGLRQLTGVDVATGEELWTATVDQICDHGTPFLSERVGSTLVFSGMYCYDADNAARPTMLVDLADGSVGELPFTVAAVAGEVLVRENWAEFTVEGHTLDGELTWTEEFPADAQDRFVGDASGGHVFITRPDADSEINTSEHLLVDPADGSVAATIPGIGNNPAYADCAFDGGTLAVCYEPSDSTEALSGHVVPFDGEWETLWLHSSWFPGVDDPIGGFTVAPSPAPGLAIVEILGGEDGPGPGHLAVVDMETGEPEFEPIPIEDSPYAGSFAVSASYLAAKVDGTTFEVYATTWPAE